MKIHFVCPNAGPDYNLLYRWAVEFQTRVPGSTQSSLPDWTADANIFFNYALFRPGPSITMPVFTHRERENPLATVFDRVAEQATWCFAQCQRTLELLDPVKSSILSIGVFPQFKKRLRFGLPTQVKASGRKRFEWADQLARDFPEIDVVIGGNVPFKDMPAWYDSLDYVLITADNEGGPLSIIEGLARGNGVISTDVGWARDFPVTLYNSYDGLKAIVNRLIIRDDRWEVGARHIIKTVERLKKK